jgi:hypothetical protein
MKGTLVYPLIQQIRDNIAAHGLAWAVRYYAKRIKDQFQFRFFMKAAYCY